MPEFVQHLLDWNARYLGSVGWLAILCLALTFFAVFAIVKSPEIRTIRSDSFLERIRIMSRTATMELDCDWLGLRSRQIVSSWELSPQSDIHIMAAQERSDL